MGFVDHFEVTEDNGGTITDKDVNEQFRIKITARNADGTVKTAVNGEVSLGTYGTITPMYVTFANGVWSGNVWIPTVASGTRITATGQGLSGASNLFNVNGIGETLPGQVRFTVKDNVGNKLPDAQVNLVSDANATSYQCQTSDIGTCTISELPAGLYSAWAEKDTVRHNSIPIQVVAGKWAKPSPLVLPLFKSTDVPVILVPGMMGSAYRTGDSIYPEMNGTEPTEPDELKLHDPARGHVFNWSPDMLDFSPGWQDLKNELHTRGLFDGTNIIDCPWDWRMPLEQAVEKYLKPAIAKALKDNPTGKVNIIAHSMGGLLVRTYIQGESYNHDIRNFSMIGTPNQGSTNTYYMWEGGDPLKVDNLTDNGPVNFYWNTTEKLYEDTYELGKLATDDYREIRKFYLKKVPSARQLLPTYSFLSINGNLNTITSSDNVNVTLTELNSDANRSDLMGTSNDDGKVRTRVYYSISESTIHLLDAAANTGMSPLYEDGRPAKNPSLSKIGDGTVPSSSAELPCDENWAICTEVSGSHAALIRENVATIANDLYPVLETSSLAKAESAEAVSSLLTITLRGDAQPFLADPSGAVIGVNPADDSLVNTMTAATSILDAAISSLTVENPTDGTYTISLSGGQETDYRMTVSYLDAGIAVEKNVRGFKHAGTTSFTFTVSSLSEEKITVNKTPQPPEGLVADAFGTDTLLTRLTWTPSTEAGVTGYKIYARAVDEPLLYEIGTAATASFDSDHPWAKDETISTHLYTITAITADGTESFLSAMVRNDDRDHDGLTDAEETACGSNVSNPDSDSDGLKDGEEAILGTNPLQVDTDGDGYSDYLETQHNSDPLDPASKPAAIISVTIDGSGTVSCPPSVPAGTGATCTVTPDPGYVVSSIQGCGGVLTYNSYKTAAITENCTVTAAFAAVPSTATISGTVSYGGTKSGVIFVGAFDSLQNCVAENIKSPLYFTVVNSPGSYQFRNVADGTYYIVAMMSTATPPGRSGATDPWAIHGGTCASAIPVTITNGTSKTGVNLTLADATESAPNPLYEKYPVSLFSANHYPGNYYVEFRVYDPEGAAQSVAVSGPGLAGTQNMTLSNGTWSVPNIDLGASPPALPLSYSILITDATGTDTKSKQIQSYVDQFTSNLSPDNGQAVACTAPVFTWTGVQRTGHTYAVGIHNYELDWDRGNNTSSIYEYDGPKLKPGSYDWHANVRDSNDNESFRWGTFIVPAACADTEPPSAVSDLQASPLSSSTVGLTWTAPGNDGNLGTAAQYSIKYSTTPITLDNWGTATQVANPPSPRPSGSGESFTVTGLTCGTPYYFAIKSADEVMNISDLSNVVTATSPCLTSATTLQSSLNPSTYGTAVTFTAKVTGNSPTGSVTFMDGAATLGSATLTGGSAILITSTLGVGTHSITAGYGGDSANTSATSDVLTQVVNNVTPPPSSGINTWTGNGPHGECITSLALNPSSVGTVYAGSYAGGVFKSTDGGRNWLAVNTGLTDPNIWALAINPSDPATIYAGTGNNGVFRSTDGGANWMSVNTGLTASFVGDLVVDPNNPATVYAGTDGGVFRSGNGGDSWSVVNNGLTDTCIQALAIDTTNPSTIFAGTASGVFKSTDGGENWSAVNTELFDRGVLTLAIDPNHPSTIYAGTYSWVFKSTNGGVSWDAPITGQIGNSVYALAIDPSNQATIYAASFGNGVFRSTDGGMSWSSVMDGLGGGGVRVLSIDPSDPTTVYAGTSSAGVFSLTYMSSYFTFQGVVTDSSGTPLSGAIVEINGRPTVYTTTDGNGGYSLILPAEMDLMLKFSKAGYLPVYSNTINSNSDILDPVPAILYTQAEASGWGVTSENGVIAVHAVDAANFSSFLSGAVATATSANHPDTPYAVTYSYGGSSTSSDGLVFVLNVDAGDTVTLHTTKDGWIFSDVVFTVQGDSVSEGLLKGVQQKVRIKNTTKYFSTLQSAFDDPDSSSVNPVQALVDEFSESLALNQNKTVTLQGGFDSGFTSNSGLTSLQGTLTIQNGSLTVENLVIK